MADYNGQPRDGPFFVLAERANHVGLRLEPP